MQHTAIFNGFKFAAERTQSGYNNTGARPLRVALLSPGSGLYGSERTLLRLAIGLARRPDFRPLVLVPDAGPLFWRCRDYGIEAAVVSAPRRGPLRSVSTWRLLLARLRHFSPDVIYSNTAASTLGAFAARRLRVGHVWHLHEFDGAAVSAGATGWMTRRLLASPRSRLVCNSDATRQHYARLLTRAEIERIYNGLDFAPAPNLGGYERHNARVQHSEKVELLMVAGLRAGKGHEDALRATAQLCKQGVPVSLTIAGVGNAEYTAALQEKVRAYRLQQVVKFVGFVEDPGPLYEHAAITLVCGPAEGFGRTAVESLAHGTPVVGTDAGGLPEVVRHARTGLLYPPGDWRALAERIQSLIEDPELYAAISATGIDWARQKFPARRFVREMADALTRAAINRRPYLRELYRHAITALPGGSTYGSQ